MEVGFECFECLWWSREYVGRKLVRILKDWRVEMEGWSVYEVTYSKDSMEACQVG